MITLEGYEIEEMRSINHIMTVELQFDRPVTQAEARNYLSRVLARANETEAKAMKEFCENNSATGEVVIPKEPETEGTIFCAAPKDENILEYLAKSDKRLNELNFNFLQEKEKGKPGPKRSKVDWDKACALKLAGWSNDEIAIELHASKGTIANAIYKHLNEYKQGKRVNRCEEVETEEV